MEKVWNIVLDNYEGEDFVIYFENYEIAKKNFDRLRELNKNMPEFVEFYDSDNNKSVMSWFDGCYNEYSTTIYLVQGAPKIYNKIVF
jgi:hypothetical protein